MRTSMPQPEACTQCPHLDQFHATCAHELRQAIIRHLHEHGGCCPVYEDVCAEAMRDLEATIE